MSHIAIRVENLSKKYVISHQRERGQKTLCDVIAESLTAPWRSLASRFKHVGTANNGNGNTPSLAGSRLNSELRPPTLTSALAPREDFWALKDVCFEIKQGEVVGVIGRNGAGKSTLLKILSRITEPTKGRIEIDGRAASLLEVGTGFHPELTGRENIYLNGAILGMKRVEIKRKFDDIVSFAEIEKFLDTPVKRYSSGMYVRLAFAVAAHLEPEILIVDEVLAVGDAEFQKKCLGKMQDVAQSEGRTILFVSHNMAAISTLTNRCIYMANGTANFIGNTDEAIRFYMGTDQDDTLIYSDNNTASISQPRIRRVELKTSLPGNIHINNSPLECLLTIETPKSVKHAHLTIQVFDSQQINYVHVWTDNISLPMDHQKGKYRLKCQIPQLRLYMGTYRVRVFFSEPPGGESFQVLDGICPFEVIMRDNSRLFQWWPKECAYVEESHWDLHPIDDE